MTGEFKLPAVWFDFYGRLIPGGMIVAINFKAFGMTIHQLSFANLLSLGIFAFLAGHIAQPIASLIARSIEDFLVGVKIYSLKVHRPSGRDLSKDEFHSRNSIIISSDIDEKEVQSKQYAEACGFFAISTLLVLQIAWQYWISQSVPFVKIPSEDGDFYFHWQLYIVLSIFMGMLGLERTYSLTRRKSRVLVRKKFDSAL